MELTEQQVTLRKLTPSEGMYLTRTDATTDRVFSKEVFLGINDSPDNWREATEQDKIEYEAQMSNESNITTMTMKMIFILAMLLLGSAGLITHSIKAKRDPETGATYKRNIKWAIGYAVVVLVGVCFSLDYFEPAAPTMEELNANPAWHNWLAGGLFALCVAAFAYSVYKAFKK